MYRPPVGLRAVRAFKNGAAKAAFSFAGVAADAVLAMLMQAGVLDAAERENRRRARHHKRRNRSTSYQANGLNGKRAVARRLRQIERGSLKRENGLAA
jgi:hypothetical protein